MHLLSLGLVIGNKLLWDEVQACLRDLPVRVVLQEPGLVDLATVLERVERARLDVLLVDVTGCRLPVEQVLRSFKAIPDAPFIVALNDSAKPDVILSAIRGGANEFLYPPVGPGLKTALERLAEERPKSQAPRQQARSLGFLSAKGGCGSTTIACHVALEIQRLTSQDVLLADFDLDSGLLGFLMKAQTTYSLLDAVRNIHRLDASYWKALVSSIKPHLDVIPSPPLAFPPEDFEPSQFADVLRFMRGAYDWIVLDLGRGLRPLSLALMEELEETYLVADLDLPSLHCAKQIVQAVTEVGNRRERLRLLLNRMPRRPDISAEEVEKILGLPVYAMLPASHAELYEAYAQGNLLAADTDLGKQMVKLATQVCGVREEKSKPKATPRATLSLF